jgi:hypothetical protein
MKKRHLKSRESPSELNCVEKKPKLSCEGTERGSEMTRSGGEPVDRRASTRENVKVPVNINPPNVQALIQDISLDGIKVKIEITPMPFQISDEVWLSVSRDYFKLQAQGKILWTSRMGDAVGIKFTQLDEKSRRSLEEFLSLFVDVPTSNR